MISSTVVYSQDFSGGSLQLAGWSYYRPEAASVSSGALVLNADQTDNGARATWTTEAPLLNFSVSASRYYHPDNTGSGYNYFGGTNYNLVDATGSVITFSISPLLSNWAPDYQNDFANYGKPRLIVSGENLLHIEFDEMNSTNLHDRWITTNVSLDSATGTLLIDLDGDSLIDFSYVNLRLVGAALTSMDFDGYGWYTGHWSSVDNLVVTGDGATTGDAGNIFSAASAISIGTPMRQSVGIGADTDDYYSFVATGNGFITASLTGLTANLDLRVYDSSFSPRAISELISIANEDVRFEVIAGRTYYLRVDPNLTASSNYTLTTTFAPVSASTISTATFFLRNGGQLGTLSELASAAYDLAREERITPGFNDGTLLTGAFHPSLDSLQPRWLTPDDLPSLSPLPVSDINFPFRGLLTGGIYVNKNAAALVSVTSDALFLTFRGTNDTGNGVGLWYAGLGTPDTDHWYDAGLIDEGKEDHYALFAQLIAAIDQYVSSHPELKVVYVSGHSLGASMGQNFMESHANSSDLRYEATLFASPGFGNGFGKDEDPRIANIWLDRDIINRAAAASYNSGDDNTIYHNLTELTGEQLHKYWLYADFSEFLSSYGITKAALSNLGGINYDRFYAFDFTPNDPGGIGVDNDTILGESGNDVILGGAGNDRVDGGSGNDALYGGSGDDLIIGGIGADRVYFTGATATTVNLSLLTAQVTGHGTDTLTGVESVTSGSGDDKLTGSALGNGLNAGAGNDVVDGGAGDDALYGGDGNDQMFGGIGNDRIDGWLGSDRAWFIGTTSVTVNLAVTTAQVTGQGTDTLSGIEHVASGSGNDKLSGDALGNSLTSGLGNDTVDGGAGNDALYGGEGNDLMFGGLGNDRIDGGLGTDRAYFTGTVAATVNLSVLTSQVTGYGTDTLAGIEHLSSGSGNDRLTGDALGNSLVSGAGNDTVDGGAGNDALYGGAGNDLLTGGTGNDRFSYAAQTEAGDRVSVFIAADDSFVFQAIGFNVFQAGSFSNLALGALNAASFRIGSTNVAADGNDFFIFRTTDTTLWFDADGSGTQRSAILIADLQTGATMSAADVLLI